jgi:hypothetical protein
MLFPPSPFKYQHLITSYPHHTPHAPSDALTDEFASAEARCSRIKSKNSPQKSNLYERVSTAHVAVERTQSEIVRMQDQCVALEKYAGLVDEINEDLALRTVEVERGRVKIR